MSEPLKIIIAGCGSRGTTYANFIKTCPERATVVGVADPKDFRRNKIGDDFNVPEERRYKSWTEMAAQPKFADAVLICTLDAMHEAPAVAFAAKGYHMLLEKPMAPDLEACRRIVKAVKDAGIIFAVCHVLRYTVFTRKLKEVLNSGVIGDIISVQHLEQVGYWHQAHSFVRGNWRNEEETSSMLLQKCCHDLDWLRYIFAKPCTRIQSFGSLRYFKKENQPEGAADRCTDCPAAIESKCPYSALKIYIRDRVRPWTEKKTPICWPVDVLTSDLTEEGVMKALREGPYGRCVFACDNDVVDHQVVNMEFEGQRNASMIMTAFTGSGRLTKIFGTKGMIDTDSEVIHVLDFLNDKEYDVDTNIKNDGGITSGHGGGDGGLMDSFLHALETQDQSKILSGVDETLQSHQMVFAAEESRHSGQVITL